MIFTGRTIELQGHETRAYVLPFIGMKIRRLRDVQNLTVQSVNLSMGEMAVITIRGNAEIVDYLCNGDGLCLAEAFSENENQVPSP